MNKEALKKANELLDLLIERFENEKVFCPTGPGGGVDPTCGGGGGSAQASLEQINQAPGKIFASVEKDLGSGFQTTRGQSGSIDEFVKVKGKKAGEVSSQLEKKGWKLTKTETRETRKGPKTNNTMKKKGVEIDVKDFFKEDTSISLSKSTISKLGKLELPEFDY